MNNYEQGTVDEIVKAGVHLAASARWPEVAASGWLSHGPFASWLTSVTRPDTFVELGTHFGFSYFAVCETSRVLGLRMRAFAVDHWQGDEHAGLYGDDVFESVVQQNEPFREWSNLLRMDFDEAAIGFAEGEVDLLHIDGFHSYEAVAHDYDVWRRTLSDRSVVLFHDVREYQEGFGVHRFWDEIRTEFPSFTFPFGHGLGVLATGSQVAEDVRVLCELDGTVGGDELRRIFGMLGAAVQCKYDVRDARRRLQRAETELVSLHSDLGRARRQVELLEVDRAAVNADRQRLDERWRTESAEHAAQLGRTETELARTETELARTETELADLNASVVRLQSTARYRALFGWRGRLRR